MEIKDEGERIKEVKRRKENMDLNGELNQNLILNNKKKDLKKEGDEIIKVI